VKSLTLFGLLLFSHLFSAQAFVVSGSTYTTDGSQTDVQAACNAAPDNGTVTVVIPNGTYSWSGTLTISRSLNLAGASAGGVTIGDNRTAAGYMLSAISSANGHINIYWLNFKTTASVPSGTGYGMLNFDRTEPSNYTVLIHDCTIDSNNVWYFPVFFSDNGIVMWNCNFPNTGAQSYCLTGIDLQVGKYGHSESWNTADSFGTQDTTGLKNSYVENCTFTNGTSSVVNAEDSARMVWRYNTITDGLVSSHGWDTGIAGVRQMEVYNNTFVVGSGGPGSPSTGNNCWVSVNGGPAVVFNNSMQALPGKTGVQLNVATIRRRVQPPMLCQTGYPAARQVGQSWSASSSAPVGNPAIAVGGVGSILWGVYVWGNTGGEENEPNYVAANQYEPDDCGNGQLIGKYVQKGRDYFVGTAKSGYTPYTYPHPLHAAYAIGGGPTPTPGPTASPMPTATVTPSPTATPGPTASPNATPYPAKNLRGQS
jgi:hypothetical protein